MPLVDYNRIISKLTEVSSSVRQYINNKEYLPIPINIDDPEFEHLTNDDIPMEITNDNILQTCYERLLLEFRDMGLVFHCSYEALLGDFYTAEKLIYLKEILIPSNLYNRLSNNNGFREQTILLLENEDTNFFISSFLNIMKDTFVFDVEIQEVYDVLWDRVFSEIEFVMYIRAILSNIDEDDSEDIVFDIEEQVKLFDYINNIKLRYKNLLLKIVNELKYDFDFNYLSKEIDKYNSDMVLSKNLNDYIWWINNKDNSVTRYLELCDKHEKANKYYIQYWSQLTNEEKIGLNSLVLLYFGTKEELNYRDSSMNVVELLTTFLRDNADRLDESVLNDYENIVSHIHKLDLSLI